MSKKKSAEDCPERLTLGMKMQCQVTGYSGIATARVEYLNGCVQFCLTPKAKKGELRDGQYIDQQQLVAVSGGVLVAAKDTGGPARNTPAARYRG